MKTLNEKTAAKGCSIAAAIFFGCIAVCLVLAILLSIGFYNGALLFVIAVTVFGIVWSAIVGKQKDDSEISDKDQEKTDTSQSMSIEETTETVEDCKILSDEHHNDIVVSSNKTPIEDNIELPSSQHVESELIPNKYKFNSRVLYYSIALLLSLVITHLIVKSDIESSFNDVSSYLDLIDTDYNIHYIAEDNIHFDYDKALSIPQDSIYDGIRSLYLIRDSEQGKPWSAVLLQRTSDSSFRYEIESPYAVGFKSRNGFNIEQAFIDYIDYLHKEEVTNDIINIPVIYSIIHARSKYHYFSPIREGSSIFPLPKSSHINYIKNTVCDYYISRDKAAIVRDYYMYSSIIFIVLSLILSLVLLYGRDEGND